MSDKTSDEKESKVFRAILINAYESARLFVLKGGNVNYSDDRGNKAL
jgi:hypothetical protein